MRMERWMKSEKGTFPKIGKAIIENKDFFDWLSQNGSDTHVKDDWI